MIMTFCRVSIYANGPWLGAKTMSSDAGTGYTSFERTPFDDELTLHSMGGSSLTIYNPWFIGVRS